MKNDLFIKKGIVIPEHELEITTSRSGGAGGQHVNKTDSKVTLRWNVPNTVALDEVLKARVMNNLQSRLTNDGDLIVHNSVTRSQKQNKDLAVSLLVQEVKKALYVPKKRLPTKVSKSAQEKRLQSKSHRSTIKRLRSTTGDD